MMNDSERASAPKVTIEELLRLKRAERPSSEFWTRFEQDLRAKQLAAIVEPRPWWISLRLPQIARALSRYQLPAGAAAVLALSFVVVREYRPHPTLRSADIEPAIMQPVAEAAAPERSASPEAGESASSGAARLPAAATAPAKDLPVASASSARAGEDMSPAATTPAALMAMIPWAAPRESIPAAETPAPAVHLGELPAAQFANAMAGGRNHAFDSRVELETDSLLTVAPAVSRHDPVEEEEPVLPPSQREVRRNRILSTLVADGSSGIENSRVAAMREISARGLTDEKLYDSVRRMGMGGDRVTLKF